MASPLIGLGVEDYSRKRQLFELLRNRLLKESPEDSAASRELLLNIEEDLTRLHHLLREREQHIRSIASLKAGKGHHARAAA